MFFEDYCTNTAQNRTHQWFLCMRDPAAVAIVLGDFGYANTRVRNQCCCGTKSRVRVNWVRG